MDINFLRKTKELGSSIDALLEEKRDSVLSTDNYIFLMKICKCLENNVLKIREFINKKMSEKGKESFQKHIDVSQKVQENSGYHIEKNGEILQITLPPLLRKKAFQEIKHTKTFCEDYYTFNLVDANLYAFLEHFIDENQVKPYSEKCLLYIQNVVDYSTPKSLIPDTDNHEYQVLINTICTAFLADDNPDYVAHLHDTVYGETNKTAVYIIPYKKIDDVLSAAIALPKPTEFFLVAQ